MVNIVALLATALLFGGMALYSFGFAPLVFSSLPADTAGSLLRRAFPYYYLFVLITAAVAAVSLFAFDPLSSALMAAAALIAAVARQILMPAINTARDAGQTQRFARLHGLSVMLNMAQLIAVIVVLVRFSGFS
jgi:hypothetical protein